MTAAVFDLCHKGHINLLKKMRKEAGEGKVVVFLHDDKSIYDTKGKIPIQNWRQRKKNLKITGLVYSVIKVTDYNNLANEIRNFCEYHEGDEIIWIRGDDWSDFPARKTVEELGIKIKLVPYTKGISSTKIRNKLEKL